LPGSVAFGQNSWSEGLPHKLRVFAGDVGRSKNLRLVPLLWANGMKVFHSSRLFTWQCPSRKRVLRVGGGLLKVVQMERLGIRGIKLCRGAPLTTFMPLIPSTTAQPNERLLILSKNLLNIKSLHKAFYRLLMFCFFSYSSDS